MVKVNLVDSNFIGRDLNINPRYFKWETGNIKVSDHVFFTDYQLEKVTRLKSGQKKVAWLIEPKAIVPEVYTYIESNFNNFDYVLTFDRELLSKIDNGLFCPYGTYWVDDKVNYTKTKNLSIIASGKNAVIGHKMRHETIHYLGHKMDVYGRGYNPVQSKNEALDQYYYSIVIENSIQDSYWTEKLLDCFMTKTIPVYWGTKDVVNFFDKDGIIFFNDINHLESLTKLSQDYVREYYNQHLDAIEKNYELAKSYKDPEDYIFFNYPHLLT